MQDESSFLTTPLSSEIQARVGDTTLTELPEDLHVPDDAMIVLLESFEGPLDLLLYLIRKHNLDILEFSLTDIADQYMQYIELMSTMRLQLAGEYLVIAATLMLIKSRALLPQLDELTGDDEDDPAAVLRKRILEYERLRSASERLDELPRLERDLHASQLPVALTQIEEQQPNIDLQELVLVFADLVQRAKLHQRHQVTRMTITVRARMTTIVARLNAAQAPTPFEELFNVREGKASVIASLLAILELMRSHVVRVVQPQPFANIVVSLADYEASG
ncbi:MAG: segregation/condensation protein A [Gammaproteobacteria bacterium]|nr:segregation/condensation protein A [Gammaproteobacteria bacterium]